MTEKERMLGGKLYRAFGEELRGDFKKAKRLIAEYNVKQRTKKKKEIKSLKNFWEEQERISTLNRRFSAITAVIFMLARTFTATMSASCWMCARLQ